MKVITSEIDKCVDEDTFAVIPGCGDFGNRCAHACCERRALRIACPLKLVA